MPTAIARAMSRYCGWWATPLSSILSVGCARSPAAINGRWFAGISMAQSTPTPRVRVTEIFDSIQGESSHAGRPCVFVRLTGCPLRCTWCDTEYAFHGGDDMTVDEITAQVKAYDCRLLEITGGEPLHQP